jgi:hypothetical protein
MTANFVSATAMNINPVIKFQIYQQQQQQQQDKKFQA